MRRQYFWHRFFSHQPDLNFENPRVREAMLDVARFWLGLGIDGFRLDAVPYLFEAEGTNCENLPETHAFLRTVREMLDREFPGRIMLAEANQWPEDVVHYFGTESEPECHMCFHFPVMPRIYFSIRDQRATPIIDILADTPGDPAGGRAVEHVPAQPRRADPRDGLDRGTRVDVRLVRARLAHARQRGHPASARAAAGQLPQGDRARARAAALPAGQPVPVLRRRDRHGRQHLAAGP